MAVPPSCTEVEAELERYKALASFQTRLLEARAEVEGAPIAWPERVEADHTREGVEQAVVDAIASCALPLEVTTLDCAEAPCVAVLRNVEDGNTSEWSALNACPAWAERYPEGSRMSSETVPCGDGTEDRLLIVSPSSSAIAGSDVAARWDDRAEWLRDAWSCI